MGYDGAHAVALTQACVSKARSKDFERFSIHRALSLPDGTVAGTLPDVPFDAVLSGRWRCQPLVDVLPVSSMRAGSYVLDVSIEPGKRTDAEPARVEFSVAEDAESGP